MVNFAQALANKKAKDAQAQQDSAETRPIESSTAAPLEQQANSVEQASQSLPALQPKTDSPANTPALAGRFSFGKKPDAADKVIVDSAPASAKDSAPATPVVAAPVSTPKLAGLFGKKPVVAIKDEVESTDLAMVSGLDSLNQAEFQAPVKHPREMSGFTDETPATMPTREIPEGVNPAEIQGFVELIDSVYALLHDAELLGQVIKQIMLELKSNPQYMRMVVREDVRTWVQAMRKNMGLARIQAEAKKAKTRTGGSTGGKTGASKTAKAEQIAEYDDIFDSIAGDFGLTT